MGLSPTKTDRQLATEDASKHVAGILDKKLSEAPIMVPLEDAVTQLGDMGLSAEFIASVFELPSEKIISILSVRRRVLTPEDSHIADGMRALIRKAQKQAMYVLEYGPTEQRLGLIKTLLSAAGRLIGTESGDVEEELKAKVATMFEQMRSGAIDARVSDG